MKDEDRKVSLENRISKVLNLKSSEYLETYKLSGLKQQNQNKKILDLSQDNYKTRKFWKIRVLGWSSNTAIFKKYFLFCKKTKKQKPDIK